MFQLCGFLVKCSSEVSGGLYGKYFITYMVMSWVIHSV